MRSASSRSGIAAFSGATKWKLSAVASAGRMLSGLMTNSIAVLPLQTVGNDPNSDYLRFALADEIANSLTHVRNLEIRPSTMTRKFAGADIDPEKVGQQLKVSTVLTGHYLQQQHSMRVTLEAIEVKENKVIWQATVSVPSDKLISLQDELTKKVRQQLPAALGVAGGSTDANLQILTVIRPASDFQSVAKLMNLLSFVSFRGSSHRAVRV